MIDPHTRLAMERDVSMLADDEIDIAIGCDAGQWSLLVVRRKHRHLTDPLFRFRDPDSA